MTASSSFHPDASPGFDTGVSANFSAPASTVYPGKDRRRITPSQAAAAPQQRGFGQRGAEYRSLDRSGLDAGLYRGRGGAFDRGFMAEEEQEEEEEAGLVFSREGGPITVRTEHRRNIIFDGMMNDIISILVQKAALADQERKRS